MTSIDPLGIVRGLLTLTLFVAFISLWIWAWSKRRQTDFSAAALLPLQDEARTTERSEQR